MRGLLAGDMEHSAVTLARVPSPRALSPAYRGEGETALTPPRRFLIHGTPRSTRLALAAACLLAAVVSPHAFAASAPRDFFFSPHGSDAAGDGSAARPWRSVAKANSLSLNPGDRVLFEGGEVFDGNLVLDSRDAGTARQPVTVGSYGAGRATLRAGQGTGVLVQNAGGVRVCNLVVVGDGPSRNRGSGVEFRNDLRGGRRLGFVRVEDVDAAGFGAEGIFVHGAPPDRGPSGFADVRITGCVARDNAHTGIFVAGFVNARSGEYANANVYVGRCLARDNRGDPDAFRENRSGSGILVEAADGAIVEYCEAAGNGDLNCAARGGPVGIWATLSRRVTLQYSTSHHNRTGGDHDGGGFCLDGGVTSSVMQYNLSHDNDGSGFGLFEYPGAPAAQDNVVRYNVTKNDGRRNGYAGIHLWNGGPALRHVQIYGNEVVMPATPGALADAPRAVWVQAGCSDVQVYDNQFVVEPDVTLLDAAPGQPGIVFRNNAYALPDGRGDNLRPVIAWGGRGFSSLDAWRVATRQEPTPRRVVPGGTAKAE